MRCANPANSASSTTPLTDQLVRAIGDHWTHGDGFRPIADAIVDLVADHVRAGFDDLDPRLGDAIADAIRDRVDRDYAPPAPPAADDRQLTLADAFREPSPAETTCARIGADGSITDIRPLRSLRADIGCATCAGARAAATQTSDWGWCADCDRGWRGRTVGGAQ